MFRWTVHLKDAPKGFPTGAAVAVGCQVYYFGGSYKAKGQIEVHIFNTVSLRWMKLPPPVTTGRGERPLEVPPMRCGHTAVLIDDIVYIWGGHSSPWMYSSELYTFDVDTHRWFNPKIYGSVPEARDDHTACVLGKVVYICGGCNELNVYTNDVYKLDTATMVWSLINTKGIPPPASSCHSATVIGTKMFVFGGWGGQWDHYNDIRVFDTETNCWLSTPSARLHPEERMGHSAFAYDGELYIFGGDKVDQDFTDLWKLNPGTFSWAKVVPKGSGPCAMSNMCCCMVGDRITLFGGCCTPDDLHILDLSPSLQTLCKLAVIQYGLEQTGLPHDIRWELAAMTKNKTASL